jgi:hypothetical protein
MVHSDSRLRSALESAVVLFALLYILAYVAIALLRMRYPYELEWLEGGMVAQVDRILAGKKLYGRPSVEFVPFIYTPLYFYVSALVSSVTGVGFFPLRLVSFLSSLGCHWLIYLIVKRETGERFAGILAAGLFAATFRLSGAWFDLARIDSLFLLLLLAGLLLLRSKPASTTWPLAGLCFALSFMTKQVALPMALPIACYCLLADRRAGLRFAAVLAGVVAGGTLLLNLLHNGWYVYYVFELPAVQERLEVRVLEFWTKDVFGTLALASALALAFLILRAIRFRTIDALFYPFAAAGIVGATWVTRLHAGAWDNALIPVDALVAILTGLFVHELGSRAPERPFARAAVLGVVLAQFVLLLYDPRLQVPSRADHIAGEQLMAAIGQSRGEVFVPDHNYYPMLAGKGAYAHGMAVRDVFRAEDEVAARLRDEFTVVIQAERFDAIIPDAGEWTPVPSDAHYERASRVFADGGVFWPITGRRTRPEVVFAAQRTRPSAALAAPADPPR